MKDIQENYPTCAKCEMEWSKRVCLNKKGKGPKNCPTLLQKDLIDQAQKALKDPEIFDFARKASLQESEGYAGKEQGYAQLRPIKPRIVETVEFAAKMNFTRLGLLFCAGLRGEAAIVHEILETNGFEVVSVNCKAGNVSKRHLDLSQQEQVDKTAEDEPMCNPVMQAYMLNHFQTQLNILMGLCVGHDSLVIKFSEAYCTVLAAKDRLLGHNPLAALYNYNSYYRYLKDPLI